jgi:hypothetical protein
MRGLIRFLGGLAADLLRGHAALVAENGLPHLHLIVAQRKLVGRARWACAPQKLGARASEREGVDVSWRRTGSAIHAAVE